MTRHRRVNKDLPQERAQRTYFRTRDACFVRPAVPVFSIQPAKCLINIDSENLGLGYWNGGWRGLLLRMKGKPWCKQSQIRSECGARTGSRANGR